MTSPTPEPEAKMTQEDELVKRLGYHQEDQATGKLVLRNPEGPEAAATITQLKSDLDSALEALRLIEKSGACTGIILAELAAAELAKHKEKE